MTKSGFELQKKNMVAFLNVDFLLLPYCYAFNYFMCLLNVNIITNSQLMHTRNVMIENKETEKN